MSNKSRALDWLLQAQDDWKFANFGMQNSHFSQVCFIAQQAAEKAIRALAYHRDLEVKGHSITVIANKLKVNGEIESAGRLLDQYYISARYPDSLPAGAPFQFISHDQAKEALAKSWIVLDFVQKYLHNKIP